jgi:hypothetical protein
MLNACDGQGSGIGNDEVWNETPPAQWPGQLGFLMVFRALTDTVALLFPLSPAFSGTPPSAFRTQAAVCAPAVATPLTIPTEHFSTSPWP